MLRQDFTIRSLLGVTTRNEIIKFSLGRNISEYEKSLEPYSKSITDNNFVIKSIVKKIIHSKTIYCAETPEEYFALKKITHDIKRLYKIRTQNRDDICEQVLRLLEATSRYGIIKIDIKSFYESIDYKSVLSKLDKDKLLSAKSISLLKNLIGLNIVGLPRGLSISPVLSEIFMRDIDTKIKGISGVFYYSRYVDDIFVLTTKEHALIFSEIQKIFSKEKIQVNKKTFKCDIPEAHLNKNKKIAFDYLGYKYNITNEIYKNKRSITITLSDDKIRKLKTRIIHSLLDRCNGSEDLSERKNLLYKRINILSGNYPIMSRKGRDGSLKGGIYYSNRLVNKSGIFKEINSFLNKCIFSKSNNSFGRGMKSIPLDEKLKICEISFREGFLNRKYIDLSSEEMLKIKKCWMHKNHKKRS
ncbi:antiviral reverse transcriptase Drt3a [Tolumonas auensis]|uniref:antiviral reverse transcriptase Drt3a n=1 Tax=Tolumonas auensis TaxID=43948 RepID=UPI002AA8F8E0|nr:antiviral reverse transcriptase Drt3a [Tolumonas auensis]